MFYELSVVQFSKMLKNLDAILDKGAEHAKQKNFDVTVLLNSRLAPDQFNLIRQVQIACDAAKLGVARLTGKVESCPSHPDTETTLEELKARIHSVIAYLETFKPEDFEGAATQVINNKWWGGKTLCGFDFIIQHCMPNVYFHVTTAYAILRHNGVSIGKDDYLGALPFQQ